jgi:recombination protein RecA
VTTGGNALKYYASVRLDVRRIGAVKKGEASIGSRTRVKVVKNKLAAPFRQVEFEILFGKGIDRRGELLDLAEAQGTLVRTGAWYSYGDRRLGAGRESVLQHLEANPALVRELLRTVRPEQVAWSSAMDA